MRYLVLLLFVIGISGYSIHAFLMRYRLRRKNEGLRDRYRLLKNSIEREGNGRRARYRIAHESKKIDAIHRILHEKYGDRAVTERRLLEEIIGYEKEKADALSISFESEITREAEGFLLLFSEDESIAFFLNLIDNALEATAASGAGASVRLHVGNGVELVNSKRENVTPSVTTSKVKDPERHGFGLGIIEEYCREKALTIAYTDNGRQITTVIKSK